MFAFPKEMRVRTRTEYLSLGKRGRRIHNALFIGVYARTSRPLPRLGITVTKKVGPAATRNRIKRQAREWFRTSHHRLDTPCDINIIAKKGSAKEPNARLTAALSDLFSRIAKEVRH